MNMILARLREPSTYAGLAAIAGAFGFDLVSRPWWNSAVAVAIALGGLVAVLLPGEKPSTGA